MDVRKIMLGEIEYEVQPLTLDALRRCGIGTAKVQLKTVTPVEAEANWYEGTYDILAAGIGMDLETFKKLRGVTLDQLLAANNVVLEVCGLIKKETKTPAPGEEDGSVKTG